MRLRSLVLALLLVACRDPAAPAPSRPPPAPLAPPSPPPAVEPAVEPGPLTRADRYASLCQRGLIGACLAFAREHGSDEASRAVAARLDELRRAGCGACTTGLEAACEPASCLALDPADARVPAWLEARCEASPDLLDALARGSACRRVAMDREGGAADRLSRRGSTLIEAGCTGGDYEACFEIGALYWDGAGPHGEMNEREGDERRARGVQLATEACARGDERACLVAELDAASRIPGP